MTRNEEPRGGPALRAGAALCMTTLLGACAPEAWQNTRASGFNAYLGTVETQCQPLWIGSMRLERFDVASAGGRESEFTALLDNTSRLYYGRISPAQFRDAARGMATSDPRTDRSIDCMIAKLPADRPSGPPAR